MSAGVPDHNNYVFDRLHLSEQGYAIWARLFDLAFFRSQSLIVSYADSGTVSVRELQLEHPQSNCPCHCRCGYRLMAPELHACKTLIKFASAQ